MNERPAWRGRLSPRFSGWQTKWRRLPRRQALGILLVILLVIGALFSFSLQNCFFDGCPDVDTLASFQPGGAPVLLDRHGEVFADLTPVERKVVPLGSLPSHVPQAFLAVEDKRFHEHGAVDWQRVGGAIIANLRAGGFEQGFSTITMQLARNVFSERIPGQEQTTTRKLLEIRVANEIESKYSKEEILELYLNHIYFGNRAQGIESAAWQYFGRPASQLTLTQAALLAALPKAPSHYDPRRHPERAIERRNLVIGLMEEQGRVPRLLADQARREPLELAPAPRHARVESGLAPYFVEQVRRQLEERFGDDLYTQPLRVRTTLDSSTQRAAEEELRRQLRRIESGELGAFQGARYSASAEPPKEGTDYLQGAVVVLHAQTGDVLAWVGGRDFAHSQFDRVAQARRQVGSAFKPFVYAAALSEGYVLSQPLADRPLRVRLPGGRVWEPKNFTRQYDGEVTLRDALVRSKNVATVRLADAVGLGEVVQVAHAAGITEEGQDDPLPSMALGAVPVSPLELTTAYTGFAGMGRAVEPRLVLSVDTLDGKRIWEPETEAHEVVKPEVAYLITDVLAEALERGTGIGVRQTGLKVAAAGKTGTTNDGADAWFAGYTPDLVAGVWIGFDRPRAILEDATGGRLAAPLWGNLVERFYQRRPSPKPWPRPERVVAHPVDPVTGLTLENGCSPLRGQSYDELFIAGMEPAAYCPGKEPVPRNGFPAARLEAERENAQEAARLARLRTEEEKLLRQRQAAEQRLAELRRQQEEQQRTQAVEAERLARAEEAREEARKKEAEQERLADAKEVREAKAARDREARREAEEAREAERRKAAEAERLAEARERREREQAREDREEERRRRARDEESSRQQDEETEVEVELPEEEDEEEEARPASDLSGWWELTNRIDSTNYAAYKGLRLGYRIQLEQEGNRLTGRGQKWSEDGRAVGSGGRTPLTVTGTIDGRNVTLRFTEHGARRTTHGTFNWILSADRTALRGSFSSTAADTS
ncbi:MAG TPA: PBP1A family penicillin-binding protein, partial [Thermoanaerobaculia bacterium]|nr:PBP1A family penicillin-binding protein [Thermoanaerobaculia bacterium]